MDKVVNFIIKHRFMGRRFRGNGIHLSPTKTKCQIEKNNDKDLLAYPNNAKPHDKPNVACRFCYSGCRFISCLIDTKCPNKTIGTINVGSQLNGKYRIAMFGWSNANCWIGKGVDNNALTTMFNKSARQMKFQNKIICRLNILFVKPKYAIKGAVMPEIISKLRPSNVINCGTAL